MTKADIITLLVIAALCAAVLLGKRHGRAQLAAALSAANAEGHAQATAEIRAQLSQTVNVVAGNSGTNSDSLRTELTATDDGFTDVELAAIRHALTVPIGAHHNGSGHYDDDELGARRHNAGELAWLDSDERARLIRAARSNRNADRGGAPALDMGARAPQEIVDL